jgi:hypothetical protein
MSGLGVWAEPMIGQTAHIEAIQRNSAMLELVFGTIILFPLP